MASSEQPSRAGSETAQQHPTTSGRGFEVRELEEENRVLKEKVSLTHGKDATKCGYLFKYRPYKMGMFSSAWELRFFSLHGHVLQYYKTEKDTAYHPRGLVNVEDCVVEVEGRKRDRFWTFSVVDQSGLNLLRMSTESERDADNWTQALVQAGCRKHHLNDAFRKRSPLRSADVRWNGEHSLGMKRIPSAGKSLNHRWEAGSEEPSVTHLETAESPADKDSGRRGRARDYTSDSGMSEASPSGGPVTRSVTKRRGEMRASSELYTETRPSMLSAARIGFTQHSGILNLMTLVLLVTNFRLILENLLKYGILTNPTRWIFFLVPDGNLPLFLCWPALALFALFAFGIEKLGAKRLESEKKASTAKRKKEVRPSDARRNAARMGRRSEALLAVLHTANTSSVLVLPCAVVHLTHAEPVPSFVIVIFAIVLWMKLVSYAHCNSDLRSLKRAKENNAGSDRRGSDAQEHSAETMNIPETIPQGVEVDHGGFLRRQYPDNLSIRDLAYFLVAPTLVYQTWFPVSSRLRPRLVLGYVVRLLALVGVLLIITEQYMEPTIANSIVPLSELKWARIFERLLKLSLPTLYGWILIFYSLFHVWLNIVAELTYFGDREFYKDWWNATTIGDYWRLWNVPVHKWLLRHVYYPALRHGIPKHLAACCVFFVSAVFHEMLVGVPLHMVRFWAFGGLMFQVPLLYLTEHIKKKAKSDQIGNITFWLTFCIFGQPMAIMMYYHDWVLQNRPEWIEALKAGKAAGLPKG